DHQGKGAFRDCLLRVVRHIDDRDAAPPGRDNINCVNPDAILDDSFEPRSALDHPRRDRRVAHQEQISVSHLAGEFGLRNAVRQGDKLDAAGPQAGVNARTLELPIGAYCFHDWLSDVSHASNAPWRREKQRRVVDFCAADAVTPPACHFPSRKARTLLTVCAGCSSMIQWPEPVMMPPSTLPPT